MKPANVIYKYTNLLTLNFLYPDCEPDARDMYWYPQDCFVSIVLFQILMHKTTAETTNWHNQNDYLETMTLEFRSDIKVFIPPFL